MVSNQSQDRIEDNPAYGIVEHLIGTHVYEHYRRSNKYKLAKL